MITATGIELRAGARLLLEGATFRIAAGDQIGLVGRNGAGKTTLTKVLAGEAPPAAGTVTSSGEVGYLPQDPRTGDLDVLARDRILSARGLDDVVRDLREAEVRDGQRPTTSSPRRGDDAATSASRPSFTARGGYAAESEAAPIAAQPRHSPDRDPRPAAARPSPAVSAAGSSWPGSCSPAPRRCCSTSRPTTSTPTRSSGCATSSRRYKGGLIVISHDVELLETTVNKVFHLDANRAEIDVYNMGWKAYLQPARDRRAAPQARAANAEKQGRRRCMAQADKMRAKATKADGRPEHGQARRAAAGRPRGRARVTDKVAKLALPRPGAVRQDPAHRAGAVASPTARWRSSPTSTWPSTGARGSSSSASTAPARPRCCASWPASTRPTPARSMPGHGLKLGYYAQEHETLDTDRTVLENMQSAAARARPTPRSARCSARSCSPATTSTSRPGCSPAARRPGSRWPPSSCLERQRAAARRADQQPRPGLPRGGPRRAAAPTRARSSWSPTTRAPSQALEPERVLLLPDGVEDLWNAGLRRPGRAGLTAPSERPAEAPAMRHP